MKNSKLRRALLLLASAVLLVSLSVGATLAYLTSTDEVENTFTVGKVNIKLDEADVYETTDEGATTTNLGTAIPGAERVDKNAYKLMPGKTYDKDPMVTVMAESEEAYIRMIVTVSDIEALKTAFPTFKNDDGTFNLAALVDGWDETVWVYQVDAEAANKGIYEFRHATTVSTIGKNDEALDALFTHIIVPGDVTKESLAVLQGVTINVEAHAIQAEGFNDVDAAWAAFVK